MNKKLSNHGHSIGQGEKKGSKQEFSDIYFFYKPKNRGSVQKIYGLISWAKSRCPQTQPVM